MAELIIAGALAKYAAKAPKRFHVPGHSGDDDFKMIFPSADADITELGFSDALSCPTGIIKEAEEFVASAVGARRAYFLTDGSTCGVLSMVYAVRDRGKKLIINRNAHQSVFNALKLCGIEPIFPEQTVRDGIMLPPDLADADKLFTDDCIGMLLTWPDYYGFKCDLRRARRLCDKYGKLLLVDGAHGAHLAFSDDDCGKYADIRVDGAHKTLPCLTQGAALFVGNEALIADVGEAVNVFRTSSPSYPIMASLEYAYRYMAENGKKRLSELAAAKEQIKAHFAAMGLKIAENGDPCKIAVDFGGAGICTDSARDIFEKGGIYCELNDGRYLLFVVGVLTKKEALSALENAVAAICADPATRGTCSERCLFKHERKTGYAAALKMPHESVALETAVGRTLAENVGMFPPCFPLCLAGEALAEEDIEILKSSAHIFGVLDGKVKVLKS